MFIFLIYTLTIEGVKPEMLMSDKIFLVSSYLYGVKVIITIVRFVVMFYIFLRIVLTCVVSNSLTSVR